MVIHWVIGLLNYQVAFQWVIGLLSYVVTVNWVIGTYAELWESCLLGQ